MIVSVFAPFVRTWLGDNYPDSEGSGSIDSKENVIDILEERYSKPHAGLDLVDINWAWFDIRSIFIKFNIYLILSVYNVNNWRDF